MKLRYLVVITAIVTLFVVVQTARAQYLGLVSKNCDNYFSDECSKILIDKTGKQVPLRLDHRSVAEDFDSDTGLLTFSYNDDPKHLKGLVDISGNVVLKPKYESIESFNEDFAFVKLGDSRSGFIDKTGKLVIRSSFFLDSEFAEKPRGTNYFSDGLALIAIEVGYSIKAEYPITRYGFIDKKGNLVVGKTMIPLIDLRGIYLRPRFEDAKNFSEGLAVVELKGKWGYVNKKDEISIPCEFEYANNFSEGLGSVKKAGKYGFIDKTGHFKIEPKFEDADEFSEGLAAVEIDKHWGYIDKAGLIVIKPQFSRRPEKFSEGMAGIFIEGGVGFGYIDKLGNTVIKPAFGAMSAFSNGLARIMTKGGAGYIRKDGSYLWDPQQQ